MKIFPYIKILLLFHNLVSVYEIEKVAGGEREGFVNTEQLGNSFSNINVY